MSEGRMRVPSRRRRPWRVAGARGPPRAPAVAQRGIPDPPEALRPQARCWYTGAGEVAVADVVLPADADLDAPLPPRRPARPSTGSRWT